ncbi:hypothetical protein [Terribacillus saccharophilus]|uniref:hypothetical protein n=1 Tax=Terribacillus saccharophilus TaxID=361277 RepID=UPI003D28E18B
MTDFYLKQLKEIQKNMKSINAAMDPMREVRKNLAAANAFRDPMLEVKKNLVVTHAFTDPMSEVKKQLAATNISQQIIKSISPINLSSLVNEKIAVSKLDMTTLSGLLTQRQEAISQLTRNFTFSIPVNHISEKLTPDLVEEIISEQSEEEVIIEESDVTFDDDLITSKAKDPLFYNLALRIMCIVYITDNEMEKLHADKATKENWKKTKWVLLVLCFDLFKSWLMGNTPLLETQLFSTLIDFFNYINEIDMSDELDLFAAEVEDND